MNILVFGASGKTGHELVRQGLLQGHYVTAFVRDPAKLTVKNDRLKVIRGDVKDLVAVSSAMKDQDAVLSALGVSKPLKSDPVVIEGIRNIIAVMEQTNVKRFIYLSFMAVGEGRKDGGFLMKNIIARIVRHEIADHAEKEKLIKATQLDWTIVHAPKLTNGSKKGIYRTGEAIKPRTFLPTLSRADLADFMLKQLTERTFLFKPVRVMY
ncbi:MAG TPA: SDR family oxidoreductase [Chitinophagaceae bacterium]|nr:SDR family oxidoreductase [Chitinophagaceae bacterium]